MPLKPLLQTLVSPAVFDFWASKLNPSLSWERPLARIVGRRQEAQGHVTLTLKPNRHFQGFKAGQHINITAEIDGRRLTRSYSPSDRPRPDGLVRLTVKAVAGGRMSRHLCEQAQLGDVLELGPSFGDMQLPASPEPLLMLAAGSGITPLMSLLREAADQGLPQPITLLYWARSQAELCFAQELQAKALKHPGFVLHTITTANAQTPLSGRINAEQLATLVPDLALRQVFACGPAGFVATARELCGQAAGFRGEAFTPPALTVAATGTVQVTLSRTGRVLELPAGQALLPALEAQGLNPAYGCRIGICNTCACGKPAGSTQNLNSGEMSSEPTAALRLCISRPCSDLTLDL